MKKIIIIFILSINFAFANTTKCDKDSVKKINITTFSGDNMNLLYQYCRYNNEESKNYDGYQLLTINVDNNSFTYTNNVIGNEYFGGEMFYSKLGIFGLIESNTGNSPLTITYLNIKDNNLILLGKITFERRMGNIIGEPIIENISNETIRIIDNIFVLNKKNILGEYFLNYYESFLFILADQFKQNLSKHDINRLLDKLANYPDLNNFYRQKIFFKDRSLCTYNENLIEMDAFGCQIGNKQLSICYNYFNRSDLIYRFGNKNKIELELRKEISDHKVSINPLVFKKNIWHYEVNTYPDNAGILIKKNNENITFLKCENESVEPYILNPIWN
ncbi:hypothetical protein J3U57_02300 [Gilliamella sp. B3464]|uniref:hypothetical protein n=1 Tax=unclassified Gilliamella TaxID=2685620 RepID=UPI00226A51C0|nr:MULTISPECIES: hypothetical protein [unclassified Gilliamella]MCX8711352.1 hypothetical protein [Gilliamella sp. B3468]MCX8750402.1 hypothetical protein [Gilliamella sp. B3464]